MWNYLPRLFQNPAKRLAIALLKMGASSTAKPCRCFHILIVLFSVCDAGYNPCHSRPGPSFPHTSQHGCGGMQPFNFITHSWPGTAPQAQYARYQAGAWVPARAFTWCKAYDPAREISLIIPRRNRWHALGYSSRWRHLPAGTGQSGPHRGMVDTPRTAARHWAAADIVC